ncbi:hypothetical protein EJ110_NYTH13326 [Nymphaea thermarum]|nr:hypothetical protein EJ110_NYTH13326 [Nymphaea thermarum]
MGSAVGTRLHFAGASDPPQKKTQLHRLGTQFRCLSVHRDLKGQTTARREILYIESGPPSCMLPTFFMVRMWSFFTSTYEIASSLAITPKQFGHVQSVHKFSLCCQFSKFLAESVCSFGSASSNLHIIVGYWVGPDIEDGWGYAEASVNQIFRC